MDIVYRKREYYYESKEDAFLLYKVLNYVVFSPVMTMGEKNTTIIIIIIIIIVVGSLAGSDGQHRIIMKYGPGMDIYTQYGVCMYVIYIYIFVNHPFSLKY